MTILKYFLTIIIPLLIILGNFQYLVSNPDFYNSLYQKSGAYQTFSQKEVESITNNLFGYFRGKNQLDHNFFSNQAILHLTDVKKIINIAANLFYSTFIIAASIIVFLLFKKNQKKIFEAFLISSGFTFTAILLTSSGLLRSFDFFFNTFHEFLFKNNLWMFTPDDNLIKLFPQRFFIEFANQLALNIILTSLTLLLVSTIVLKIKNLIFEISHYAN